MTADARTLACERLEDFIDDADNARGSAYIVNALVTPEGAALVAEAAGAEKVWWCDEHDRSADGAHGHCRNSRRWLLPATEET